MALFNLLLVEDNDKEIETFRDTLERYQAETGREINPVVAKQKEDALANLSNTFDGAIVDINLNRDRDAGNQILDVILNQYRIPVVVYTATPADVPADYQNRVKVISRGTVLYDVPLDYLFDMYNTGLTNILGGRGSIESLMNDVFWKNIVPQLDTWTKHKTGGKDTEKALLRLTINHIIELIDEYDGRYIPEEMYISPVISKALKTGCIVKKRNTDQYCVVLSPACDLALHNGQFKTDRVMVCLIEKTDMSIVENSRKDSIISISDSDTDEQKKVKAEKIGKAQKTLKLLQSNNYASYFHYLPKTNVFEGGFINFRKVETFKPTDFGKGFESPSAQISTAFVKDIVSRFSSYYARQGQPDFDLEHLTL